MTNSSRGEKKRLLHVGSYEVGKTLGNGSFGKVKLGTNVFTKEKVAIKFFNHRKFATLQQIENTKREIEIMKLLSHPNIVKLIDVIENKEECTTYLIAEYVSGGELFDYIVANGVVKEKQARHFLRQIISAVEFCHANLIVHRDLKPENLLLDANGNIKISDFGLSNMIEPGKLLDSFCGSPLYAAPEILLAERYNGPPIDVWSIGVILFALLCGHLPWNGESQAEISHNSIKGIYDDPTEISEEGRDIIRKMLNPNPRERISIAEIRKHPWINLGHDGPPVSMLEVRAPVLEVQDDLVAKLVALGFKDGAEIRKLILDNECCQVVAMYHLLLDRKVAEELAELKKTMMGASATPSPSKVQPPGKLGVPVRPGTNNPLKNSLKSSSGLSSIVEEEANEISPAEWNKIQEENDAKEEHNEQGEYTNARMEHKDTKPTPNYHHQHESTHHQHDVLRHSGNDVVRHPGHDVLRHSGPVEAHSPRRQHESRNSPQRPHRPQLSSSVNGTESDRGRHRRFSVAGSVAPPDMGIRPKQGGQEEPRHASYQPHHREQGPSSHNQSYTYQQDPPAPPPRGRKFSLDSRSIAEHQQMAQEHSNSQAQGPGAPRMVKGVFKSSTTTTRPPAEAAKLVKKVLSNSPYFVKRKSPFIFECFDDATAVKFQLEVCKISQLNMTGIHLKRLLGDIWLYKTMCSQLVNQLCL